MAKLTKRIVDAAKPREAPIILWCSELPGFGCRIYPSGKKTYVASYRTARGEQRRPTIGPHGTITTEEARKLALDIFGEVVRGNDPANDRRTRRKAVTVEELCAKYLAAAESDLILGKGGRPKKKSTLAIDRGRIDRHIIPLLGRKVVVDLTTVDINRFVRDVAAGKTGVVERDGRLRGRVVAPGGKGTATRTAGLLGGILTYAVRDGIIAVNPAQGVLKPAYGQRTRRLTVIEYRHLGLSLEAFERSAVPWQGLAGIRLLALTGCRRGEIAALKWSEVDLDGHALRLDDSKEGSSTRPIGGAAKALLSSLPRSTDSPYVLPSARRKDGFFRGIYAIMVRLAEDAGLEGVSSHTLRHSFASMAGDLGFADSTIGALLGHTAGTVTGRYVHRLDSILVAAADKVAGAIAGALVGEQQSHQMSINDAHAVENSSVALTTAVN